MVKIWSISTYNLTEMSTINNYSYLILKKFPHIEIKLEWDL